MKRLVNLYTNQWYCDIPTQINHIVISLSITKLFLLLSTSHCPVLFFSVVLTKVLRAAALMTTPSPAAIASTTPPLAAVTPISSSLSPQQKLYESPTRDYTGEGGGASERHSLSTGPLRRQDPHRKRGGGRMQGEEEVSCFRDSEEEGWKPCVF